MPKYSIVVPLHNEQENVTDLYGRLKAVMESNGESFEMVLVDDGSTDRSFHLLREIAAVDSRVTVVKLRSVRVNSKAPNSKTSDMATWETTSMRRSPHRSRLAVRPRLPPFMAACGETSVARSAGVRPNRMHVNVATAAVNASTGQSGLRSTKRERPSVLKKATRKRLIHCARTNPSSAPKIASKKLSASN